MLAVYPGSFDPPTVAHLAVVRAALDHVDEVRLVLSEVALGKEDLPDGRVPVAARRAVLEALAAEILDLSVALTRAGLIADIAEEAGADAVVVGTDKWAQILDPAWYGASTERRDDALRRLPRVLLAPRAGVPRHLEDEPVVPPSVTVDLVHLDLDPAHRQVSSTRARAGELHLMAAEARASGHWA
ncbi:MAG: hypothetical protein ACR2JF_07465 [Iamia sp.]